LTTQAFVYKWIELDTGKWYIGSRTSKGCHIHDGYLCSSKIVKPMILANPSNWKREILVIGEPQYIRELEEKYLTTYNAAADSISYNQHNANAKFNGACRKGIKESEELKKKKSIRQTGKKYPPEFGKAISDRQKGIKPTKEQIEKRVFKQRGRPAKKVLCPNCNKIGSISLMKRWHFDNCRVKNG